MFSSLWSKILLLVLFVGLVFGVARLQYENSKLNQEVGYYKLRLENVSQELIEYKKRNEQINLDLKNAYGILRDDNKDFISKFNCINRNLYK